MLLGDAVDFGARMYGDRTAILFGEQVITFNHLQERVNRLSNALLGIASPGDRIAILSENRPEFIEAYYGVPMAGMGLTFLNYRLNPKEMAQIVTDAEASVLLTEPKYLSAMVDVRSEMPSVRTLVCTGEGGAGA